MKQLAVFFLMVAGCLQASAQNVGIGTLTPTENLHVVGNKALFDNNFVSIGAGAPVTAFTRFQVNKNVNTYVGMYINAGATGTPFYGYALNGTAKAYTGFNGTANQFEYHQSSDAVPDFLVNGNSKAVFNTAFVGIGTSTPTTGFTGFAMKTAANSFYGSYIDAGATGTPFYGYALNGVAKAYLGYNGNVNQFEYHQSSDAVPDFLVNGNSKAVFNTAFVGIGTSTPTTAFTGFAMKTAANSFYGSYIDAGPTGTPFYGYALNGTATAYTAYNGSTSQFEYHHSSDGVPDFLIGNTKAAFPNISFLGIGTNTPTTGYTGFAMKTAANAFYGSYIDAGPTGTPFYGYALNGTAKAYTGYNGNANQFEYHQSSDAVPDFLVNGNSKAVFNTAFVGIGTSTPTTGYTGFAMKTAANAFYGSYIDAGPTGTPFYGYALNGSAKAYTGYNGTANQFEYHQSSDAVPDFLINGNSKAVFNTAFVGIGTSTPTTAFTGFAMKTSANAFYGSYIDAGATGTPFYGYALNGTAKAYTGYNGTANQFEYHQSSDAVPDFLINGNSKAVFNTAFVGIGTSTPTTAYTGFAMKTAANAFYGSYIDAGATGTPFYGYALNGTAKAYTGYNGTANQFEYHQSSDAVPDFLISGNSKAVFNTAFVGIGTSTPTTGYTGFAMKTAANSFYGSYIDAGTTGTPFYGYALNGTAIAYTGFNGTANQFEYHQSSDAVPDFLVNGNSKAVFNTAFVGIGTSTPTTGSTGLSLKKNSNSFWGMYIDAGATGKPFYGYALNGSAIAYTQYNGSNSNWELVTNSNVAISVSASGNVGFGVTIPTQKLDVAGTIHAANLNGGATSLSTDAAGNIIRTPSDMNLKVAISDINDALGKVEKMHGVTYDFKDKERFGSGRQMGFLAQELEQVVPEAVSSGGEYKSVNYQVLTALIAEAVKQQQTEITKTQNENSVLKAQVQELLERIKKLEKK